MTIIEPKKLKSRFKLWLILIIFIIFGWGFLNISFYNQTVDLKHQLTELEKDLQELEVGNAEAKNKLFSLLNEENMSKLIASKGMVLDKKPVYLGLGATEDDKDDKLAKGNQ